MATITSIGYPGKLRAAGWADTVAFYGGAKHAVGSTLDWLVSVVPGVDRTVKVASGTGQAWGAGILDVADSDTVIQSTAPTSGTRWDTIVVRKSWQAGSNTGASTIMVLPGTATMALSASVQSNPGATFDQPLALVQYSSSSTVALALVDLRPVMSAGVARVASATARAILSDDYLVDGRATTGLATLATIQALAAGATSSPTASTMVVRDASGRTQAVDPLAAADVATMGWTQSAISSATAGLSSGSGTPAPTYGTPVSWSPQWLADATNPTGYDAVGSYIRIGQGVWFQASFTANASWNGGSGNWKFSLPFTADTSIVNKQGVFGHGYVLAATSTSGGAVPGAQSFTGTNSTSSVMRATRYDGAFFNSTVAPSAGQWTSGTAVYFSGYMVVPAGTT